MDHVVPAVARGWVLAVALAACGSSEPRSEPTPGSGSAIAITADAGTGDGVKRRAVPCVPERQPVSLAYESAESTNPLVCAKGRCIDARAHEVVLTPTTRPPTWLRSAELRHDGATWSACLAADCKPVGPKLTAALDSRRNAEVTLDRRAVVIGTDVWQVQQDRKLVLAPPAKIFGKEPGTPITVAMAGNHLVVTWVSTSCPDPAQRMHPSCSRWGQLLDSSGVGRDDELHGFDPNQVLQVDDDLFAVTSDGLARITLYDFTGRPRWRFDHPNLGVGFRLMDTIRVRPGAIASVFAGSHGLIVIELGGTKDHPFEILYLDHIPYCEGRD